MNKNDNIIIINGRHYDAKSGEAVAHPVHHTVHHAPATKHEAPATVHSVKHRKAAGHAPAHRPKPAQTLMRQTVKKPPASFKSRIKVQGHLDSSAERATSKIIVRSSARLPNTQHLQSLATKRSKGQLISHFSPNLFSVESHTPAATYGTTAVKSTAVHAVASRPAPANKPRTTAELLDYAVQHANVPEQQPSRKSHRKLFKRHVKHHARA